MIRSVSFSLLAPLLAALLAPLAAAQSGGLSGGPATLLSAPAAFAPSAGGQSVGTIVPSSDGWFAIWSDELETYPSVVRRRVMVTRLAPDGSALDTTGIRVVERSGYFFFTAAASPEGVRVFWAYPEVGGYQLETATVSRDGEVSASSVVGVFPTTFSQNGVTAAASGSRFAVHLHSFVMIVDGARHVRTVDLGGSGDLSSIVAAGSHFVVSWSASAQILMRQTIDLDGNVSAPAGGIGVASPARPHALATDGAKALLSWGDQGGTHVAIVDPATNAHVETAVIPSAAWSSPRAVWNGSSYLVVWATYDQDALLGIHVSPSGALLDETPARVFEGTPGYYFLAARGAETLHLSQTGNCVRYQCETEVYARLLGSSPAEGHLVSASARSQTQPAAASDGAGFLALWREGTAGVFVAETFDRQREPAAPLQLSADWGSGTAVAGSGAGYVGGWIAFRGSRYYIEAATLTRVDGRLVPKHALSVDAGFEGPHQIAVASAPDMHLVAWQQGTDYFAVRIAPDGTQLDSVPVRLWVGEPVWSPPVLAFDGVDFLVAGFAQRPAGGTTYDLLTQRITRGGTVSSDRTWVTAAAGVISGYSVGCGSGSCMIAWSERVDPWVVASRIKLQRFLPGGGLADPTPIESGYSGGDLVVLDAEWDGSRYLVITRKESVIAARAVPATGSVAPAPLDAVAANDDYSAGPATACNQAGRCLAAASRRVDEPSLGRTWRVFKSFFGEARHRAARP